MTGGHLGFLGSVVSKDALKCYVNILKFNTLQCQERPMHVIVACAYKRGFLLSCDSGLLCIRIAFVYDQESGVL